MAKPLDLSKFRTSITKSITGISAGYNDPQTWISTGNFTLNKLISGDFKKGIPLGKVTMFAGETGAGKSYICSGNVVKNAQEQGIFVVLMDTENALDEKWLNALGVDTSEDKLLKLNVSMIDDVAKILSEFITNYKADYDSTPKAEKPKVLFVVDSLGMLLTPVDEKQFQDGDLKGDFGRKPKQLMALVRNTINVIGDLEIGLLCSNHTYASQDMFSPDDKVSGGSGPVYASSIVVAMKKNKLKEDENGTKTTDVNGIKAVCKVIKTRYAKPFEEVVIKIPYDTGMSLYSGLFEFFEKLGILVKQGNRYKYTSKTDGKEYIEFRKNWTDEMYDMIMNEFDDGDFVFDSPEIIELDANEEQ